MALHVEVDIRPNPESWFRSSSAALVQHGSDRLDLNSSLQSRHSVIFVHNLLDVGHSTLSDSVGPRDCLIVTTPTVDRLYGNHIRTYFDARHSPFRHDYFVLACSEATKTLDAANHVVERATAMNLGRRSPIIAIGGGVCLDICGFAASIYRRGVPHIKVPTTLLGLIDAGIGTKNGLNNGHKKSIVGSFYPPEFTLLDTGFIASLDRRFLRSGMAESLKMAIACDAELFDLIETHGANLVTEGFARPRSAGDAIIRRSVTDMLEQLSQNLFEQQTLERLVDFGHSFSPVIESRSGFRVHHGEAVAIDMAISVLLARDLSFLPAMDADRVLRAIRLLGLPIFPEGVDASALWDSLATVTAHRDGKLRLPLPTAIGSCVFLPERELIGGPPRLQSILDELRDVS